MKESKEIFGVIKGIAPFVILALICIIFALINPRFLSLYNLKIIAQQSSIPLIIAIGATWVIVSGSIDLSVEGGMSISALIFSFLILNSRNNNNFGFMAIPIAIAGGTGMGLLNGMITTKVKIPSFISTLGMWFVGQGISVVIYGGYPAYIRDSVVRSLAIGSTLGFPNITIIALFAFVTSIFWEKFTRFARYVYAIGGNEQSAKLVGIPVCKYKIFTFALAGTMSGLGGILNAARLGSGTALVGEGTLFGVLAAVLLGGTAITGGVGGIFRTLAGILIITILSNAMIIAGISPHIQIIIQGAIIIITVGISLDRSKIPVIK